MIKSILNKILKFGNVELHGLNYMHSLRKKAKESNEFNYFKTTLKSTSPTVFDVGANRGLFTEKMKIDFPNAKFYLFEPLPELSKELSEKFKESNITVSDYGISDCEGTFEFCINKSLDTSSFLLPKKPD